MSRIWYICYIIFVITSSVNAESDKSVELKENEGGKHRVKKLTFELVKESEKITNFLWPLGVVPIYFDTNSYDNIVLDRVRSTMKTIEEVSCVKFQELTEPYSSTPWIHVTNINNTRECTHSDANATVNGFVLELGYDCLRQKDILHSLMHALGFKDEVTHPQRNNYIQVLWGNINPKYFSLFMKRFDDFFVIPTEYDPTSIMQFHDRAFSRNGHATLEPMMPGLMIDPLDDLSSIDKMRLRLLFGQECNKKKVGEILKSCKDEFNNKQKNGNQNNEEISIEDNEVTDQDTRSEDSEKSDDVSKDVRESEHETSSVVKQLKVIKIN